MNKYDIFEWVKKVVESCETLEQVHNAEKLVISFRTGKNINSVIYREALNLCSKQIAVIKSGMKFSTNNNISEWLSKHGDPKIELQVMEEALDIQQAHIEKLEKERRDLVNWLKSELKEETSPKMGRRNGNQYKIQLFQKILSKLN